MLFSVPERHKRSSWQSYASFPFLQYSIRRACKYSLEIIYLNIFPNMRKNFLIILSSSLIIITAVIFFSFKTGNKKTEPLNDISCTTADYSGMILPGENLAIFEGQKVEVPLELADQGGQKNVLGMASEAKWIEVDLSEQKLKAWE